MAIDWKKKSIDIFLSISMIFPPTPPPPLLIHHQITLFTMALSNCCFCCLCLSLLIIIRLERHIRSIVNHLNIPISLISQAVSSSSHRPYVSLRHPVGTSVIVRRHDDHDQPARGPLIRWWCDWWLVAQNSIHYNLRDTVNGHFIRRNIKTIYPNDIACRWSFELIVWPIDRWINKRAFSRSPYRRLGTGQVVHMGRMLMNRCFNNNKVPPAAAP